MASKIGFKVLLYLVIATQFVAAGLSLLIFCALSIPLFTQLKNGTFRQSSALFRRRSQDTPSYSIYNLYLVYLALLDLFFLLCTISAEFCTMTPNVCSPQFWSGRVAAAHPPPPNTFDDNRVGFIVNYPYGLANILINAVITYEIWLLLKATRRRKRITQPSLMRVNLQCGGVILGSVVCGVFNYYIRVKIDASEYALIMAAILIVLALVPLSCAIGVTLFAKYRGYMPSANGSRTTTTRDRAVRGLALYFFRVIIVFISIWIPAGVLVLLAGKLPAEIGEYLWFVAHILFAVQPILTFWMVLGKDDVKKYIKDFLALFHMPGKCTCCNRNGTMDGAEDTEVAVEQTGRKSVTILGYIFEETNGDADNVIDATFGSSDDDANEQDPPNNNSLDSSTMIDQDGNENNGQAVNALGVVGDDSAGNPKYKSRRIREGAAVRVLATGEVCPISLQPDDQA